MNSFYSTDHHRWVHLRSVEPPSVYQDGVTSRAPTLTLQLCRIGLEHADRSDLLWAERGTLLPEGTASAWPEDRPSWEESPEELAAAVARRVAEDIAAWAAPAETWCPWTGLRGRPEFVKEAGERESRRMDGSWIR